MQLEACGQNDGPRELSERMGAQLRVVLRKVIHESAECLHRETAGDFALLVAENESRCKMRGQLAYSHHGHIGHLQCALVHRGSMRRQKGCTGAHTGILVRGSVAVSAVELACLCALVSYL